MAADLFFFPTAAHGARTGRRDGRAPGNDGTGATGKVWERAEAAGGVARGMDVAVAGRGGAGSPLRCAGPAAIAGLHGGGGDGAGAGNRGEPGGVRDFRFPDFSSVSLSRGRGGAAVLARIAARRRVGVSAGGGGAVPRAEPLLC